MHACTWGGAVGLIWLCIALVACSGDDATTDEGGVGNAGTGGAAGTAGGSGGSGGVQPGGGSGGSGAAGGGGAAGAAGEGGNAGVGEDAGVAGMDGGVRRDAGATGTDAGTEPGGMIPIDAPVPDDCITDVSPGDHTFTCQGLEFLVMVDEQCTRYACGLIFDVHGAAMSGESMRTNTHLHELAPPKGYLVVHPTANGGTWDWETEPPILVDFMSRMIDAFHVDENRIHVTGFSMGAGMTFWFLCNHRDVLASTAPVTGASADQVTDVDSGENCIQSIDESWRPRVPILFMSGTMDDALTIDAARERTHGLVDRLGLTGGDEIGGDDTYTRRRWTGEDGMVLDFLEHDYSNTLLAGHCIPGGGDDFVACTEGGDSLHWGEVVLEWFIEHPKQ